MQKVKITFKGQVTIPKNIRNALAIKEGDSVIFSVEGDHAVVRPIKRKALEDFYGSFLATKPFPDVEAVRKEIHEKIAKRFQNGAEE